MVVVDDVDDDDDEQLLSLPHSRHVDGDTSFSPFEATAECGPIEKIVSGEWCAPVSMTMIGTSFPFPFPFPSCNDIIIHTNDDGDDDDDDDHRHYHQTTSQSHLNTILFTMTGASNVSTDKMLNLPKASDSEETKQEKEKTDVVKR